MGAAWHVAGPINHPAISTTMEPSDGPFPSRSSNPMFSTDVAHVVDIRTANGDPMIQVAKHLERNPEYRLAALVPDPTMKDTLNAVFTLPGYERGVWFGPDGDLGIPGSQAYMSAALAMAFRKGDGEPRRVLEWVEAAGGVATKLRDQRSAATSTEIDRFWLRLYGVVTEAVPWITAREPDVDVPRDYEETLAAWRGAREATEALIAAFMDRDRFILTFFRHHAAHVRPTNFYVRDPGVAARWQSNHFLGRAPSQEEVVGAYHTDERQEASQLAERVAEPLGALDASLRKWLRIGYLIW